MIRLYRLITIIIHALVYPYGKLRAIAGDCKWQGRLGLPGVDRPVDIWMHAASVGEVKVICHLVNYLHEIQPGLNFHVTAMTKQGVGMAISILADCASVSYFPFDTPPAIRITISKLNPRLIIVAETEIWPNLVLLSAKRHIPCVLVNGRMSAMGFRRYRLVSGSLRHLLACYNRFFFKTAEDRDRYSFFGVPEEKSQVAGDMKFDAPLVPKSAERVKEIRSRISLGDDQFLLVAGSTRPGEEDQLLDVYQQIKDVNPQFRLLIAPRHLERLDEIRNLFNTRQVAYRVYNGEESAIEPDDTVIVVDRMGILNDLYLAADMAFVGGTLVDIGGHNILEPVWARTPVVFGPYLDNVAQAAEYIKDHNYGQRVSGVEEFKAVIADTMVGRRTFAEKSETDVKSSATAIAGDYILQLLNDV